MPLKKRKRVLIVDDEALVRDVVAEVLSLRGYQAVLSPSWDIAEDGFEHIGYALVITDIFMPGKGGIQAIEEIRRRWPDVKILAISGGWGDVSPGKAVEAAAKIGADAALAKPFDEEELVAQVRALIGEP